MKKIEYFGLTNETIISDYSEEEIVQHNDNLAEYKKLETAKKAEAKAKETAKAAILDRIGLTADELKTILG
jgi:hypothetical protein